MSATGTGPPPAVEPGPRRILRVLLVVFAALVLRLSSLDLPLGPEAAAVATRADAIAHGRLAMPPGSEGTGPLLPALCLPGIAVGMTPTRALRATGLALGVLWVPLLLAWGRRLPGLRAAAAWAALLAALDPVAVLGAGGPATGAAALEGVLLLVAPPLLLASGPRMRRGGALAAILLPLADPLAAVQVPGLVAFAVLRERAPVARAAMALLAVLAVVFVTLPPLQGEAGGVPALLLLLAAAAVLVLLPALVVGAPRLLGQGAVVVLLLAGLGLETVLRAALPWSRGALHATEAGLAPGAAVVPFVLLAGALGLERLGTRWRRPLRVAAVALASAGALLVGSGAVRAELAPRAPGLAGRLLDLGDAVRSAADAAGAAGTVALELPGVDPVARRRLADLAGGRPTVDLLDPADAGRLEGPIGLVTATEDLGPVSTLSGRGIFRQTVVGRHGRWVVCRLERP